MIRIDSKSTYQRVIYTERCCLQWETDSYLYVNITMSSFHFWGIFYMGEVNLKCIVQMTVFVQHRAKK